MGEKTRYVTSAPLSKKEVAIELTSAAYKRSERYRFDEAGRLEVIYVKLKHC